ncbi:MAG: creatininase family protein [Chloroflexi bacterium]|nr:creatininase family protein [Chloroflexota bacterium]
MQWENLTASDFATAVHDTNTCVIAMGVVEKHSEHLPLGTDYLIGHRIACLAAERESAVVFPPFYFGQIYEARCFPGTVTIRPGLLVELIQGTLDEIGRNGFGKIVVYNAHGGNWHLIQFLAQCALWEQKPYQIYIPLHHLTPEGLKRWEEIRGTTYGGHADEEETSLILGTYPHLARLDRVPAEPARRRGRMDHLPPTFSGIAWYSDYPDHYAGDARTADVVRGQELVALYVDALAQYIAAVKADTVTPALTAEFYARVQHLTDGEQEAY